MQQQNVNVVCIELLPELVDLGRWIASGRSAVFGHQFVAVAPNALERDGEHLRHAMIAFRRFEKADASIVSVTDLPGELLLPELTLHPSAVSAGAEREARDFDIRFAQRDPIRSGPFTAAGL